MKLFIFLFLIVFISFSNGASNRTVQNKVCNTFGKMYYEGFKFYFRTFDKTSFPNDCDTNVTSLYLKNNFIYFIGENTFEKFSNICVIDISFNNISGLPRRMFSFTPKLKEFYASDNNIIIIQKYLFAYLPQLTIVNLANNKINQIETNAFKNVPSLSILKLYDNNLKTLSINFIDNIRSLNTLQLYLNPWECTSSLCEFMHVYVNKFWDNSYFALFNPVCSSPKFMEDITWKKVIDFAVPSVESNIQTNPSAKDVVLTCHTCTQNSLSWKFHNKTYNPWNTRENRKKYFTTSTLTIYQFSYSDIGNYSCQVKNCSRCWELNVTDLPADFRLYKSLFNYDSDYSSRASNFPKINFPQIPHQEYTESTTYRVRVPVKWIVGIISAIGSVVSYVCCRRCKDQEPGESDGSTETRLFQGDCEA